MAAGSEKSSGLPDRERALSIYRKYRPQYENALQRIHRRVRGLLNRHDLNPTVKFRSKGFDSYFQKLLRLSQSQDISPVVKDFIGLRIICPFLEDLERVENLLAERFTVVEIERKGLQHSFREFGYDSTHLIVQLTGLSSPEGNYGIQAVCEIQLRTILQEAWAEIEHELIYKADFSWPNESIKRKLASLNATLNLSDLIFQEIRDYQEEIRQRREQRNRLLEERIATIDPLVLTHGEDAPAMESADTFPGSLVKPKSPLEKLLIEGLNAHSANRYDAAIRSYSRILALKTDNRVRALVYNHRGMAYFSQEHYKRALHDFNRAIDFDPNNHRLFYHRGLVWRLLKRPEKALDDFDRTIELNPLQAEVFYGRAQIFFDLGNYPKAVEDCDRALEIRTDFVTAAQFRNIVSRKMLR